MIGNHAFQLASAVYLESIGTGAPSRVDFTNVLLARNTLTSPTAEKSVINAYAHFRNLDLRMNHLTFADNLNQAALRVRPGDFAGRYITATLTNTLIVNTDTDYVGYVGFSITSATILHTNTFTQTVANHHVGQGSFGALFIAIAINPLTGDAKLDTNKHLLSGSAAIDAGVDAGIYIDIDGQKRPFGLAPDIGADEYSPLFLPLILR